MESHHQLSDAEFEKQFSECTLDPKLFSHEAHLRLVWIHITKYGLEKALVSVKGQIMEYVASLGAQDKYNETVTIAGLRAVNHFIQQSDTNTFPAFILENIKLKIDFKGLLLSHYSTNIFESDKAKKEFIEPELKSFE